MSCKQTSKEDLESITPVRPPTVNKNKNPRLQTPLGDILNLPPLIVAIHLNTFTPVGTAITIVKLVK